MFKKISQNFGIFLDLDEFPFFGGQIIDIPVAELFTVELLDTVACGCDHALDLMIFALGNGHHQCVWVGQHCFGGGDGFIIVMQEDAVFQCSAKGIVGRMFQGNAVELRNFVFGRSNAVVKLPSLVIRIMPVVSASKRPTACISILRMWSGNRLKMLGYCWGL